MRLEIKVTPEDIADGKPLDTEHCPVALAVQRITGRTADVHYRWLFVEGLGRGLIPADVTDHICQFDDGDGMEPFRFAVELADRLI